MTVTAQDIQLALTRLAILTKMPQSQMLGLFEAQKKNIETLAELITEILKDKKDQAYLDEMAPHSLLHEDI
jgi:hypothetical protein